MNRMATRVLHAVAVKKLSSLHPHVTVCPRSDLIDKMLARYSSDHVVLRELLQNADDAGASDVEFRFVMSSAPKSRGKFVAELRAINNGKPFSDDDWTRVARIAEGNPSEDSVGMFGVGTTILERLTCVFRQQSRDCRALRALHRLLLCVFSHGVTADRLWTHVLGVHVGRLQAGDIQVGVARL